MFKDTSALPWLRNLFDCEARADQLGLELQGSLLRTPNPWELIKNIDLIIEMVILMMMMSMSKSFTLFVRACNPLTGFASDFSFDFYNTTPFQHNSIFDSTQNHYNITIFQHHSIFNTTALQHNSITTIIMIIPIHGWSKQPKLSPRPGQELWMRRRRSRRGMKKDLD